MGFLKQVPTLAFVPFAVGFVAVAAVDSLLGFTTLCLVFAVNPVNPKPTTPSPKAR